MAIDIGPLIFQDRTSYATIEKGLLEFNDAGFLAFCPDASNRRWFMFSKENPSDSFSDGELAAWSAADVSFIPASISTSSIVTGAAGSDKEIQFNNNGVFGASSLFEIDTSTFSMNIRDASALRFYDDANTGYIAFKAPAGFSTPAESYTWPVTHPGEVGNTDVHLIADTTGALSWERLSFSVGGDGTASGVMYHNSGISFHTSTGLSVGITDGDPVDVSFTVAISTASVLGICHFASTSEIDSGGDAYSAGAVLAPVQFHASDYGVKAVCWTPFGSSEVVTEGDGIVGFLVPPAMDGWKVHDVIAGVVVKDASSTCDIMVRRKKAATRNNQDLLTTPVTISTSSFYANDGVASAVDIVEGDLIYVDIDAAGVADIGLSVTVEFRMAG